jgi:DNA-binding response OmpR family regulator
MAQAGPAQTTILVVDDEPDAIELADFNLRAAGFEVLTAADGNQALQLARKHKPDLILLDVMLPKIDGLEVCKLLRRDPATADIPVIMLTAKAAEIDRVLGLELGADDYVTKPFSPRELVLRIKNLLRRHTRTASEEGDGDADTLRFGPLRIETSAFHVTVAGEPVDLTATEFKLLTTLATRRGRVQTRDMLLRDVWGYDSMIDTRTVDTHIRRLREKLGAASELIETIRGMGYRFVA